MKHAIQAWLKAGVMEGQAFSPTESGTPQSRWGHFTFTHEYSAPWNGTNDYGGILQKPCGRETAAREVRRRFRDFPFGGRRTPESSRPSDTMARTDGIKAQSNENAHDAYAYPLSRASGLRFPGIYHPPIPGGENPHGKRNERKGAGLQDPHQAEKRSDQ